MDLNKKLGLPDSYEASTKLLFEILLRFHKVQLSTKPITQISYMYYFDHYGNFNKKVGAINNILKDMFDNLDIESKMNITSYMIGNK